jgi:hypothetical protein
MTVLFLCNEILKAGQPGLYLQWAKILQNITDLTCEYPLAQQVMIAKTLQNITDMTCEYPLAQQVMIAKTLQSITDLTCEYPLAQQVMIAKTLQNITDLTCEYPLAQQVMMRLSPSLDCQFGLRSPRSNRAFNNIDTRFRIR